MGSLKDRVKRICDVLLQAGKKFGAEDGSLIAAAVSFYGLLSILPLLLLGVSVLGYIVGSSDKAFSSVVSFFNSFMPTTTFITDTLKDLVAARGVIGLVGVLTLIWTGSQLFVTLETALDNIREVRHKPGLLKIRLKAILLVIAFGVFMLLSVASSGFVEFLSRTDHGGALVGVLGPVLGVVFAIGMFLIVYKFTPDAKVGWREAIVGAVFSGIVWSIAKELYRFYLAHLANFNRAYGSLGGVVILIMWIYYSCVILIFGAELGYVVERSGEE